jgi:hypothetical protein
MAVNIVIKMPALLKIKNLIGLKKENLMGSVIAT